MEEFETDLDKLETAVRMLFQTMKRPQRWTRITDMAGIAIDRPSATILHILMIPHEPGWRIQDLAVQLGVEAPSVTRKSQELESAGLVRRVRNPQDRRSIGLELTARGRSINAKLRKAQRAAISQALSSWSAADRRQFVALLTRFAVDLSGQPDFAKGK